MTFLTLYTDSINKIKYTYQNGARLYVAKLQSSLGITGFQG